MPVSSGGWEPEFASLPADALFVASDFGDESAPPLKRSRVDAPLPGGGTPSRGTPSRGTPDKPSSATPTSTQEKKLRLKLIAAGPDVLADLLLSAVADGSYAGGVAALTRALPAFDVDDAVCRFEAARSKVDRNMPRYASGNNFCYNRVKGQVGEMRSCFAGLLKTVAQLEDWFGALRFATSMVTAVENEVMSWEDGSKNKWKETSKKKLEALALKAATQISKPGTADAVLALEEAQQETDDLFSPEFDTKLDALISKTKTKSSKAKSKK